MICGSQIRRHMRRSLDETMKIEIIKNKQRQPNSAPRHVKRRNSLPDMPNIMDNEGETNAPTYPDASDREWKQEKHQDQTVTASSTEQKNRIAELNIFSSSDLQQLNDQNRELNNVSVP